MQRELFEELYHKYNRREFVHPDPLEFLYEHEEGIDREIAGLVASSLAYGRVGGILRSVRDVLSRMGLPGRFVAERSVGELRAAFEGFRHRFATGDDVAALLWGAGKVIREYGSLERCFAAGMKAGDDSTVPALTAFAERLTEAAQMESHLLACPSKGSACKRLHLFLRWMVRRDEVDPGGWEAVPAAKLVVPLDTHMYRICRGLGLTVRKAADGATAMEITRGFREICPEDPVKYDFALTRLGIRREGDVGEFLRRHAPSEGA